LRVVVEVPVSRARSRIMLWMILKSAAIHLWIPLFLKKVHQRGKGSKMKREILKLEED